MGTDSEAEAEGEPEGGTKLEENSSQPKNKQKGILYTLTGEEKELVKCCVLKNYNLKLSVVISSSNSNYIYWKKERKCMCYFNL